MDAAMGSLYDNNDSSSISCHGNPASSDRYQELIENYFSIDDDESPISAEKREPLPLYRSTKSSITNDSSSCRNDMPLDKLGPKQVSWSSLNFISIIDLHTSPETIKLTKQAAVVLPPPPLVLNEKSATVVSDEHPQPPSRKKHSRREPNDNQSNTSTATRKPTKVISLPWTDHRGVQGQYTGEVNSTFQPHGAGSFRANHDSAVSYSSSAWDNGRVIVAKIPMDDRLKGSTVCSSAGSGSGRTIPATSSTSNSDENAKNFSPSSTLNATKSTALRGYYYLGELAKHPSHMHILPPNTDPKIATKNADSLKPFDFAFVLRSDETWTYSIVADRPIAKDGPAIRFVLNRKGSTKTIGKKYWAKGIRLVNSASPFGLVDDEANDGIKHIPLSKEESPSTFKKVNGNKESRIYKKINRRGFATSCSSLTDIAMVAPISRGFDDTQSWNANTTSEKKRTSSEEVLLDRIVDTCSANTNAVDKSGRGGSALGRTLKTIISPGSLEDEPSQRQDSHDKSSSRKHLKSKPCSNKFEDSFTKSVGSSNSCDFMKNYSSFRKGCSSFQTPHTVTHDQDDEKVNSKNKRNGCLSDKQGDSPTKNCSSFHSAGWGDNEKNLNHRIGRNGIRTSIYGAVPNNTRNRSRSRDSMGSDVSSVSDLFREMFSSEYLEKS